MEEHGPPQNTWPMRNLHSTQVNHPETMNIVDFLVDTHVESGTGDSIAILYENQRISYRKLSESINRFGNSLMQGGVKIGDRIVLHLPNRPEMIISTLAIQKIGAIPVPLHPALKAPEIEHVAKDSRATMILSSWNTMGEVREALPGMETVRDVIGVGNGMPENEGEESFDSFQSDDTALTSVKVDPDEIALLLYTSGTTSLPKGCIHTHGEYLSVANNYGGQVLRITPGDVMGGPPSLAFAYGHTGLMAIPLRFGAATSLNERFDPSNVLEIIRNHRITVFYGVPTIYRLMLKDKFEKPTKELGSLRLAVTAGEPCPSELQEEWRGTFGCSLINHIGSTEMFDGFLSEGIDFSRPGSLGTPVPGYTVRIFDDEDESRECGLSETGRLAIIGPTRTRYWNDIERQSSTVRGGWNYTGDLAYKDSEGVFWFVGREDDIIKSSAFKISPYEVEQVLINHPKISQVAVAGIDDDERGQKVKAFVIPKDKEVSNEKLAEEIIAFARERIAHYKAPREVEVVKELPRSVTGKLRRSGLVRPGLFVRRES